MIVRPVFCLFFVKKQFQSVYSFIIAIFMTIAHILYA